MLGGQPEQAIDELDLVLDPTCFDLSLPDHMMLFEEGFFKEHLMTIFLAVIGVLIVIASIGTFRTW